MLGYVKIKARTLRCHSLCISTDCPSDIMKKIINYSIYSRTQRAAFPHRNSLTYRK